MTTVSMIVWKTYIHQYEDIYSKRDRYRQQGGRDTRKMQYNRGLAANFHQTRKSYSAVIFSDYESDLRGNEHYLSSSVHYCTGFEPMTSVIPMQCSTN